jgi:hypothetical protein
VTVARASFANGPFGIDHPLVVVRDLDAAADALAALGFTVTPRGRHPWGTHNRLALFPGGLLELMTLGEPEAVETNGVDHGLFGRHVARFLDRHGEGVCMLALHSIDLDCDIEAAQSRGLRVDGVIDFRRPVTLPGGTRDEAVVRLAMLTDRQNPHLSLFLCQQLKRGLVEVPAWTAHPNGASRLAGVTYLDDGAGAAARRASAVWGAPISPGRWATAGGYVDVVDAAMFEVRFGTPPSAALIRRAPAIGAIAVAAPTRRVGTVGDTIIMVGADDGATPPPPP